jgi:transcriptional regulator with XRE-family HTH domain
MVYNKSTLKKGCAKMSNLGNKETFAKNLSYLIDKHGIEQKELAEIVGVAPSTFNAWVKAKKYPRIDKIERLANYFGILKSDLIEEKENNSPTITLSLTKSEESLLNLFRKLPDEKQTMVLQMIQVALNSEG